MSRLIVVVAVAEEARYVPAGVEVVVTGIGKTQAAVAVTRAVLATDGDVQVANIGTAGGLRDDVNGHFEPGVVINHDVNVDAIRALGHDPHERLELAHGAADVVLATGDAFIDDVAVRDRLAERAMLVDMEGYAVAWACQQLGVPLRMAKHVSDHAGDDAHDWPAMVDRSARELGAWLRSTYLL